MKTRVISTLLVLVLMMGVAGGCGKDGAADLEGLKLGKDLTGLLDSAGKALGNITDLESARAALPQLKEVEGKLDGIVSKVAKLSPESKDSFAGMVKGALPALEGAMDKVMENETIRTAVKPTLDSIMAKVKSLI